MANMMLGRWYALTKNPTKHELLLEKEVAKLGIPYRFQWLELRGKANAIIDFAFPTIMVALEIDGPDHFTKAGLAKDKLRTQKLNALGWRVVRLTNGEVEVGAYAALMKVIQPYLPGGVVSAVEIPPLTNEGGKPGDPHSAVNFD